MKLVDTEDLKSSDRKVLRVRVPPSIQTSINNSFLENIIKHLIIVSVAALLISACSSSSDTSVTETNSDIPLSESPIPVEQQPIVVTADQPAVILTPEPVLITVAPPQEPIEEEQTIVPVPSQVEEPVVEVIEEPVVEEPVVEVIEEPVAEEQTIVPVPSPVEEPVAVEVIEEPVEEPVVVESTGQTLRTALSVDVNASLCTSRNNQDNFSDVRVGDFILHNNAWNAFAAAPGHGWLQCINADQARGTVGWTYDWGNGIPGNNGRPSDDFNVRSYPELIFGVKDEFRNSGDFAPTGLPISVANITDIRIDYGFTTSQTGTSRIVDASNLSLIHI